MSNNNLVKETRALLVSSTSREGVQAVRLPSQGKTIDIATHKDSTTGQEVVLWSDITLVFRDALYLQYGTKAIPFLKGADLKTLDPLRIAAVQGATLDVVVDDDDDDDDDMWTFGSSMATPRVTVQKTKSKKPPAQKSRPQAPPRPPPPATLYETPQAPPIRTTRHGAPQTMLQEPTFTSFQSSGEPRSTSFFGSLFSSGSSVSSLTPELPRERYQREPLVPSTTTQWRPTNESVVITINTPEKDLRPNAVDLPAMRNPQYGLVEEAMANYSHIEAPEGTFESLTGKPKHGAGNPQCDSSTDNTLAHSDGTKSSNTVEQAARSPQVYSTTTTSDDTTQTVARAIQGDTGAQVALGDMYREGKGVNKDLQAALDWFLKAAEQGDAEAQYKVGALYNNGEGVTQEFSMAEEWYLRAAKQGHAPAQWSLGSLYESGQGGRVPEIDRDYRAVMEWYLKASDRGDAQAQYEIGRMFDHGVGVTQDDLKARQWYLQAAEKGHLGAKESLQSSGSGVKPQAEKTTGTLRGIIGKLGNVFF
ncbi:hypothetical protein BGW39_003829 [Mortierella sp. 14UC]|nr:hypothetical protein BGW39_003829 [Mortierella sp. 14UC]